MLRVDTESSEVTRERKNILLGRLKEQFSLYFNFLTSGSLASRIAYNQAGANARGTEFVPESAGANANNERAQVRQRLAVRSDPVKARVFEIFLDSNEGATPALQNLSGENQIRTIKRKLEDLLTTNVPNPQENIQKIADCVRMHYSQDIQNGGADDSNNYILSPDLDKIGFAVNEVSSENNLKQKISAFEILHPLMAPGEKNAELLTVFFNAMPLIELQRATPILNIKFYSSRKVEQDGKLGAITLHKFLEGAVAVPQNANDPLRAINLASQVSTSSVGFFTQTEEQNFSVVGLELFKAPQTLQNIDATKQEDNYLAKVIDPMRPLASIKSLEIDVKPSVGLMSTKTAKLDIILHDRSRLGEFADFVKPDRYGQSFIDIEYGWSHPDGISLDANQVENPFAQMLNLIRNKEHYGIMSSNFSFDDVGQVNITLNLYTRGTAEAAEVSIANNSPDLRENIKKLEDFSRQINRISSGLYGNQNQNQSSQRRTEIRGQQMLNAAGDAQNMLILNNQLLTSLRELRRELSGIASGNSSNVTEQRRNSARQTLTLLNNLVGEDTTRERRNGTQPVGGVVQQVQQNVNESILETLRTINSIPISSNAGNVELRATREDPYAYDIFLKNISEAVKARLINHEVRNPGRVSEIQDESSTQVLQFQPNVVEQQTQTQTQTRTSSRQRRSGAQANGTSASPVSRPTVLNSQSIISLGTLVITFVAKPLAKLRDPSTNEPKFSEVQVYFYGFNNKASMMSRCNIAMFPIFTDFFAREYSRTRLENTSRAVNFTVSDFMSFIANKMIDDPMNPAYNIQDLYSNARGSRRQNNNRNSSNQQEDNLQFVRENGREITNDEFNRRVEARMVDRSIGNISGSPNFIMPQVSFEFEAVPDARNLSKTILKIHIFDRASSPNSSLREILDMSNNDLLSTFSAFPGDVEQARQSIENVGNVAVNPPSPQENNRNRNRNRNRTRQITSEMAAQNEQTRTNISHTMRNNWLEIHQNIVEEAINRGLITPINPATDPPTYVFTGGPKRLKEMVMEYMPHIIYGAMGTTVKNASISSKQDPLLASMNMVRNLNADPVLPNGQQIGGVPLSVYPIDLSLTTLGCPLLRFSQEMFIDFNTNTTADNIYYILGLTHRFEAGTFESNIKFTANDAFGQYRNFISQLNQGRTIINALSSSTTS